MHKPIDRAWAKRKTTRSFFLKSLGSTSSIAAGVDIDLESDHKNELFLSDFLLYFVPLVHDGAMNAKTFPIAPSHPERLCWGCDRYCKWNALACGNGADRTPHPVELFGSDWMIPLNSTLIAHSGRPEGAENVE